ncbi:hypothetical protein Fmac_031335 [Flemingia macrophylla]|uniref:S-adenosyl-L-methionine-dependent methyltransferase n=1 Tax=Flemingia macrophylla TaxID=520843 RepID=A0ABD1L1S2_9FABA
MAKLFVKQAKQYANARPTYPQPLFQFIASKTPSHNLVRDAGTGSGLAAKSLAAIYKNVIGADASEKQLEFAANLPNVRYRHTPPTMSMAELEQMHVNLLRDNYKNIDFPFEPVNGANHTGTFKFVTETAMDFNDFLTYIKSWSAYQTAKAKGVELLGEDMLQKFKLAWGEDGQIVAKLSIYLRIGSAENA